MKNTILILCLVLLGCALSRTKRAPEVVASCFSDGENQSLYCKSQRINEYGKVVTTRCIGKENRESPASLRGKCVEKICSEGSNTDCEVKGEFLVLQQYADLMTARQFASDESDTTTGPAPAAAPATAPSTAANKTSIAGKKMAGAKAKAASSSEVDVDPSAKLAPLPTPTPEPTRPPSPPPNKEIESASAENSMSIALKPAKPMKKKTRTQASVPAKAKGFQKVCIEKSDKEAPTQLRGKCATRTCVRGKCTYKGRKEMFDWLASRAPASEDE